MIINYKYMDFEPNQATIQNITDALYSHGEKLLNDTGDTKKKNEKFI